MKLDWQVFIGKTLNVTMHENYGMVMDEKANTPIYEIAFKNGKLIGTYDDGILLETIRDNEQVRIFIPHASIKCVEIFDF